MLLENQTLAILYFEAVAMWTWPRSFLARPQRIHPLQVGECETILELITYAFPRELLQHHENSIRLDGEKAIWLN